MSTQYDKWLVVSDIDGTLNSKGRTLPRRNFEAIEKFVQLGGHFTLASGRRIDFLEKIYKSVPCNAPAVVLNGAVIYDYGQDKIVRSHSIEVAGQTFFKQVLERFPLIEAGVFFDTTVCLARSGILSRGQLFFERGHYKCVKLEAMPKDGWRKIVFWSTPHQINRLVEYTKTNCTKETLNSMRTSPVSLELVMGGVHKGTGVLEIAKTLGIDKAHIAAIGDYYNDWDMLKSVGLPACAGQAPQDIHDICTFEACHCNQGCVADLIEYIMKLEE